MLPRFKRALSQEIFFELLIEDEGDTDQFRVVGTTGQTYSVSIKKNQTSECTCKDYEIRKEMCKHILAIFIKHYCLSLTQIRSMFNGASFNDVPRNTSLNGDDCPVCFIPCRNDEWNCEQCLKTFHYTCMSEWCQISLRQNIPPSCPMCRHPV